MFSFVQTVFRQIIVLSSVLLFAGLMCGGVYAYPPKDTGIIKANKLNLRSGPSIKHPSITMIKYGEKVEILEHQGKWLKVSYKNKTGYIRNFKQYIEIEDNKRKASDRSEELSIQINEARKKAEEIDRKIEEQKAEVIQFTKKETAIINSLNDLEVELNKSRRRVDALRSELKAIGKKIEDTDKKTQELIETIKTDEAYTSNRLVSLYKLNSIGIMNVLASSESMNEFLTRKKFMETILEYDEQVFKKHMDNKDRLSALMDSLNAQKKEKLSFENDFNEQIRVMNLKKDERKRLFADISNKKALGLAAIESLKKAAEELDGIIASLQLQSTYADKGGAVFSSYKGLLKLPVEGIIISFFGPYKNKRFNVVNFRSGIEIKSERGEPVRSVGGGEVLFSSWFKGYGNMIIIDHGESYYTVYAHADELLKKKGDIVKPNDIIATVGDTASMSGTASLYFEIRHHGKPMDPVEWLKKG